MKIKCPKCNAAYDLELECSGRKAECGVCGKKFPVCFELEETINVLIKKYHLQQEDASLVRTIIRYHEVYPFFLMRKTGKSESYIEDALNRMEQNEMLTLPFDEIGHRHILFLNRFQLNYHSILPPDLLLKHLQEDEKHFREHFFRCFCPFCNQEYKTLPKEYNMKDAECGRCGSRFKMTPYPETEPTRYHVSAIAEPKIPPKSVKSDPVEPETVNSKSVIAEPPPLVMGSDTAQPCCHIKSNIANVEPAKPESMERNLLSRWNRSQYLGRLLSLPSRKWVSPILAGLNNEQLEAVKATKGYIRVVAGAGTGKTRVLIQRLAYLIQDLGIPSDRILSVTFTNKAAGEMKNRVRQLLGDNINSRVQTFHGFCNTVLREDIHRLCYPPTFSIMDEEDQKLIIKDTFSELKLTSRDFKFKEIKKIVSKLKNNAAYVEAVTAPMPDSLHDDPEESMEQRIVKSYLRKQRKNFFLDYDDLIMFTLHLFHKVPAVLIKWQERLSYIQVDEFQDVNRSQYDLVNMLALKHKNLFVVGDPDQTIYEWRGANVHFFLDFPADKTILLSRNYRSVMEILKVGNTLIANNKFRINNSLCSVKKRGERPLWYHAMKFGEEGRWIASKIAGLFGQYHYSDCAILCRSLHVTRRIEEALINESIPYHIFNGTDFYSRKEVKDALSFLRLIAVGDDLSFLRVINLPPRGMGKKRIDLLKEIAAERKITLFQALAENLSNKMFHQATGFMEIIQRLQRRNEHEDSISDILNDVLQSTEYEAAVLLEGDDERKKNLEEFKRSVYNLETGVGEKITLQEYLNQISMYSEKNEEKGEDTVKIMTIHTAKGMEFPCVFVAGLNEGTLPNTHALLPEEIEQERRVAYVAFTRAKEKLFLSSDVDTYNWDGVLMKPSRFVDEISNSITICNQ